MKTYVFPGQGSQHKGMGSELFDEFPELVLQADQILGYSIKNLCQDDPDRRLLQTQFTQPALYVVNALKYLKKIKEAGAKPDFVAGHSLGEYNALFAAGAFDFETGLRLVKKRGELMSLAVGGGMAAVIGVTAEKVVQILKDNKVDSIDIANYNAPSQTVIAGKKEDILRVDKIFVQAGAMYIPLNVSGAFHSRHMKPSAEEFAAFIEGFAFFEPGIPVVSNVAARPYRQADVRKNLVEQIVSPVKWTETIRYLMGKQDMEFEEVGPGNVLAKLVLTIRKEATPLIVEEAPPCVTVEAQPVCDSTAEGSEIAIPAQELLPVPPPHDPSDQTVGVESAVAMTAGKEITPLTLGCSEFRKDYNLSYAYVAGSMYRGISSKEMVVRLGKAGIMGFWGAGGVSLEEMEAAIAEIQKGLPNGEPYGVNLIHNLSDPEREERKIDLFLKYGVTTVEASAFLSVTPALIRYRASGLRNDATGNVSAANRIIAKVSRPEVAEMFLSPAPERLVEKMTRENRLTEEQARLLREVPVADDICVEADSGGHTDAGVAYALMPAMLKLRDKIMLKQGYKKRIRVGAAGGIGTPEAAAAAFILGADFIMTGSINQCTVEAGTSSSVKDLLQQMNVQDTEYAPSGDMFELGAKVQVLKKGLFFPARANKLFELYRFYDSIDDIDPKTRAHLEEKYFKCGIDQLYRETKAKLSALEAERTENNPKKKMALVFKTYFDRSTQLALNGSSESRVDYQIQCGPALGAFNQWVKGTELEDWRNRHVDELGIKIMSDTAELLNRRFESMTRGSV